MPAVPAGLRWTGSPSVRAVAVLVAEGLSNSEIAARLYVSQGTVKSHLATVMRRLNIRSRTQLAILINRRTDLPA